MGVGLVTKDNYTSKEVCDASKRTFAGTQVQSCEALPGDHASCDNFYVCDAKGNCNPCQSYDTGRARHLNASHGAEGRSCKPAAGNCHTGTGWQ